MAFPASHLVSALDVHPPWKVHAVRLLQNLLSATAIGSIVPDAQAYAACISVRLLAYRALLAARYASSRAGRSRPLW
jgi:hypothetical protein